MSKHLQRDLDRVKVDILRLGYMVENQIMKATKALIERNSAIAEDVVTGDDDIDRLEIEIEEECLKILALHQPLATDLRFIVAVMKVNNDLERMGDLAVNISQRALFLSKNEALEIPIDFKDMVDRVRKMVHDSLDALINQSTKLARRVCAEDDVVDEINRKMFTVLETMMMERADTVKRAVQTLSASRHLERIADLATNIAEDVVFMADGDVIRHGYNAGIPPYRADSLDDEEDSY
ncbi:MAG: phosphate signaling complex protein PhoU [Planctomycetes bacterium]|nr:phosphate signaling complex protein PhoU [Planctomycetota bacterium]